jgi:hypothetical protein
VRFDFVDLCEGRHREEALRMVWAKPVEDEILMTEQKLPKCRTWQREWSGGGEWDGRVWVA